MSFLIEFTVRSKMSLLSWMNRFIAKYPIRLSWNTGEEISCRQAI